MDLTTSELKVLYAYYKENFVYSDKKKYGVSTTQELEEINEHLKTIVAIEYGNYNYTQDHSIGFGNELVISSYGRQLLRDARMI